MIKGFGCSLQSILIINWHLHSHYFYTLFLSVVKKYSKIVWIFFFFFLCVCVFFFVLSMQWPRALRLCFNFFREAEEEEPDTDAEPSDVIVVSGGGGASFLAFTQHRVFVAVFHSITYM